MQYPNLFPPEARVIGRTVRLHYVLEKDLLKCRVAEPGKEPAKDAAATLLRREAPAVAGKGRPGAQFQVAAELRTAPRSAGFWDGP